MTKAVVFGGSGFLGSHVADTLSDRGYNVLIFDKKLSEFLRNDQEIFIGDIQNQEQVNSAVVGADYVFHFACIADIAEAENKPVDSVKINVLSTVYILEACRKNKVKRIFFASTIYVYSQQGSFYRSSKQSAELFIENYHELFGLEFTILRYGSLYGPRANSFNFIHNAISQAILEKKIIRKGDGNEIRDYIHVIDAARASANLLAEDYKNSYVMITGNQTIRVKELLEMIKEMLNNEIEIIYSNEKLLGHYEITPYSFRPKVARKYVLDYYHDLGQGILDCIYENSRY